MRREGARDRRDRDAVRGRQQAVVPLPQESAERSQERFRSGGPAAWISAPDSDADPAAGARRAAPSLTMEEVRKTMKAMSQEELQALVDAVPAGLRERRTQQQGAGGSPKPDAARDDAARTPNSAGRPEGVSKSEWERRLDLAKYQRNELMDTDVKARAWAGVIVCALSCVIGSVFILWFLIAFIPYEVVPKLDIEHGSTTWRCRARDPIGRAIEITMSWLPVIVVVSAVCGYHFESSSKFFARAVARRLLNMRLWFRLWATVDHKGKQVSTRSAGHASGVNALRSMNNKNVRNGWGPDGVEFSKFFNASGLAGEQTNVAGYGRSRDFGRKRSNMVNLSSGHAMM